MRPNPTFRIVVMAVTLLSTFVGAERAAAATTPPAQYASDFAVTVNTGIDDFVGRGLDYEFDAANSSMQMTADARDLTLNIQPKTGEGDQFEIMFGVPAPGRWHRGFYTNAVRTRTPNAPYLDIAGDGRGCDQRSSGFDVRDVRISGGIVHRLDLVYYTSCSTQIENPSAIGEIRIGEPHTHDVVIGTAEALWGPTAPGTISGAVPVAELIRNTTAKPVRIGRSHISGANPSSFRMLATTCTRPTLASGHSCTLTLLFDPRAHGPLSARVTLAIGRRTDRIPLEGIGSVGKTSLIIRSPDGDGLPVGTFVYRPANSLLGVYGFDYSTPRRLQIEATSVRQNENWLFDFSAAHNAVLTPGDYPDADRQNDANVANRLDVTGGSFGCGTNTGSYVIDQAEYGGRGHGDVQHFRARFSQRCGGAPTTLTATLNWNYAPVTTRPPTPGRLRVRRHVTTTLLRWSRPQSTGYAYSIVRVQHGAADPVGPSAGALAYRGTAVTAQIPPLSRGEHYTISVYDIDRYGNISAARTTSV